MTLLSSQQAAARLGIRPRTLYRLIDQGDLPAYRVGRLVKVKACDVDAYLERCRI